MYVKDGLGDRTFPAPTTPVVLDFLDLPDSEVLRERSVVVHRRFSSGDGTVLDRYGQRIPAQVTTQRPARLPSGEPNIYGDWAQEQYLIARPPTGRGGLVVVRGDASARCGISMKGADIVVEGSVGHMSAFMAQKGALRHLEDL